jgi:hypothetical protein
MPQPNKLYITDDLTPIKIAEHFADDLQPNRVSQLAEYIEKYTSSMLRFFESEQHKDRISHLPKKVTENFHISKQDMLLIDILAEKLPAKNRAHLMRLTTDELKKLVRDRHNSVYTELTALLQSKLVDRMENMVFDLTECLDYLELNYTADQILIQLKKKNLPTGKAQTLIDHINETYKVLEDENTEEQEY